jgi:RNA polymerase sigma-70 factor, ECF subfamily
VSAGEDLNDVEAVLRGETSRFEGIVRRWQSPLINLAFRFCRDRGRAEDMAQEAFLRAYRALGQWRREGAFSTWLFALASNVYRTELRRIPASIPLEDVPEPADHRSVGDEIDARRREETVRRAVATMPAKYRDVLVLFYFHDMDVAAAGKSLSLPDGTIKARLSRARDMLRNKLRSLAEVEGVLHER